MTVTSFRMLALSQLHESKLNPRKSYDKDRLAELTASIKTKGVLQPIVTRPNADGFEVVCGARRLRAAREAGLTEIPAVVRELSDVEALEVAVIENLQRADVHEIEEAEGYEQLMKLHKQTADDLAAKVGKSKAYVYARLKLLALSPAGRKAFYEGALNASTALLVARIPGAKLQEQALKEVTELDYRGDRMPVRQAAEHIQRRYMLQLKSAPFSTKDPKLVAKAGACGECPKRTGNQPELFADVGSADVCTDPQCFNAKKEAHYQVLRDEARAKGQEVIEGKEAKTIKPYSYGDIRGYSRLEDTAWSDATGQTKVSALLKKVPDVPVKLFEDPHTRELVKVVETADGALVATMLWEQLCEAGADGSEHLAIAYGWIEPANHAKGKQARGRDYQELRRIAERFPALSAQELWRVLIDLALAWYVDSDYSERPAQPKELYEAAARHGVDPAAIRAEVLASLKAKAEETKTVTKAKAAKKR
jgi:ParB/RepB/Spo0J family partition protein